MPPSTTTWGLDPHTRAKHDILRAYLSAWLPMLSRWHGRVLYIDGFAGPGEYTGGETGSPIIAVRALLDHGFFPRMSGEFVFLFIEKGPARLAYLRDVALPNHVGTPPANVRIQCIEGDSTKA